MYWKIMIKLSLLCWVLNSQKCSTSIYVLKAVTIVSNVHFVNLSTIFAVSHFLSAEVSPEWRLHQSFGDPQKVPLSPQQRCPFNRGNKYKRYVNILPGSNFVPPEWRCPLNRSVSKERFHCTQKVIITTTITIIIIIHNAFIKESCRSCEILPSV